MSGLSTGLLTGGVTRKQGLREGESMSEIAGHLAAGIPDDGS